FFPSRFVAGSSGSFSGSLGGGTIVASCCRTDCQSVRVSRDGLKIRPTASAPGAREPLWRGEDTDAEPSRRYPVDRRSQSRGPGSSPEIVGPLLPQVGPRRAPETAGPLPA